MTKMDRPDGLGLLWIAVGAGLTLLFVVVTVLAVVGKSALLELTSTGVGQPSAAAPVIAGGLTTVLLIAGLFRWRGVRKVRMWMLTVLAGLTCAAWIVFLANVGSGSV
ncbi:hypothetical protein [Jannaschia donghaensis]|uniref:Uncharacterized protein n=1 Tax=Jannaschia donghaensis TaxID=420998 RepID=A0A0M6YJY4_9RHOB|nr:hypothetical protein [Jannaschia donghaensis]CTQ49577.1 hypothetical protein JDO7802_01591 [Jannaschia donghaensis]